ncbi:thiol-disulfide isomerase/thioredoxin [Filimonas zeae]|uniref:Thioredoxin domain-containing protein n=1 Tax=Filimonas zeae TaxID=1737353 RepID=A0A917IW80_9BACT|nr:redoxin domain-containing protein [Filimonas zeae]MDR6339132.1 thiol-disulfide isomerase/thioredoxin [Filimonas zeae]GGH64966.1 hypothetical protein GCM10011379_17590 [Filimonas zeae]
MMVITHNWKKAACLLLLAACCKGYAQSGAVTDTAVAARGEGLKKVYDTEDPIQKEAAFKQWISRFAPERFGSDRLVYDYGRNAVANAFAQVDSVAKALYYTGSLETPFWRAEGWSGVASVLLRKGHTAEAEKLYKKAVQQSGEFVAIPNPDNKARFAAVGYPNYCAAVAEIAFKAGRYDTALAYLEPAYRLKQSDNITELYANTLAALNRNSEALLLLEKMVKQGRASAKNEAQLKQLYTLVHGNKADFATYVAALHDSMAVYVKEKARAAMVHRPAPLFTLKDLKGKTVSLDALKGKVVVLDFWATWCGPCKRSFPAMQLAVNKYQQDTTVRFLFIDTWERTTDAVAATAVSSFIQSNNYTFQVLLDGKDAKTNTNKAVTDYGVKMIPAKFVIDAQGNIRFELAGFDGSNESAVAELSAMIELAKQAS